MNIPQYITQLTKEWIRNVSKRLVQGNCIRIKEDSDNREIAVDIDALKLQLDLDPTVSITHSDITDWDSATSGFATTASVSTLSTTVNNLSSTVSSAVTSINSLTTIVNTINNTYITESDLSGYATQTWVENKNYLTTSTASSTYLTKTDAASTYLVDADLDGYATEAWVESQDYLTDADMTGYVDTTTDQTVGGVKTFSRSLKVSVSGAFFRDRSDDYLLIGGGSSYLNGAFIILGGADYTGTHGQGVAIIRTFDSTGKAYSLSITPGDDSNAKFALSDHVGKRFTIENHFNLYSRVNAETFTNNIVFYPCNGSSRTGLVQSGRIDGYNFAAMLSGSESVYGGVEAIHAIGSKIQIKLLANNCSLPDDSSSTSDYQIAWRGWVNDKFYRKATSSTGLVYNAAGTISYKAIGSSGGVQAYSAKLAGIAGNGNISDSGAHNIFSTVHTAAATASARFLYIAANSTTVSSVTSIDGTKFVTVGTASDKWVKTGTNGVLKASDEDVVTFANGSTLGANNAIVTIDGDGKLTDQLNLPTSNVTSNKCLGIANGTTSLTWLDAATASDPSTVTTMGATGGSTTLDTTEWTAGNTNGLKLWVTSRVVWNGTTLTEYRRLLTFNSAGILYSVGAEITHTVNTPTVIRWKS